MPPRVKWLCPCKTMMMFYCHAHEGVRDSAQTKHGSQRALMQRPHLIRLICVHTHFHKGKSEALEGLNTFLRVLLCHVLLSSFELLCLAPGGPCQKLTYSDPNPAAEIGPPWTPALSL